MDPMVPSGVNHSTEVFNPVFSTGECNPVLKRFCSLLKERKKQKYEGFNSSILLGV